MLVAQGESDTLVVPATTAQYVQKLCSSGEHVQFHTYAGIDHGLVGWRAVLDVLPFFVEVMAGRTPTDTCSSTPAPEPAAPPGSTPGTPGSLPPAIPTP
jgi:hypothetical protein